MRTEKLPVRQLAVLRHVFFPHHPCLLCILGPQAPCVVCPLAWGMLGKTLTLLFGSQAEDVQDQLRGVHGASWSRLTGPPSPRSTPLQGVHVGTGIGQVPEVPVVISTALL